MRRVVISDVVVTSREVLIPAACPRCNESIDEQINTSYFEEHAGPGQIGEDGLSLLETSDFGESTRCTSCYCPTCDFEFANGSFTYNGVETRPPIEMGKIVRRKPP